MYKSNHKLWIVNCALWTNLRSSYEGHKGNALAPEADEGRGKLRKAMGSRKQAVIRRYPNGETWQREPLLLIYEYIVYEREPGELKHLSTRRKRKKNRFPK